MAEWEDLLRREELAVRAAVNADYGFYQDLASGSSGIISHMVTLINRANVEGTNDVARIRNRATIEAATAIIMKEVSKMVKTGKVS